MIFRKNRLVVNVTQRHIESGKHNSSTDCMVALAIREVTGKSNVVCGFHIVRIGDGLYHLLEPAPTKILDWEKQRPLTPFQFVLKQM